jgi:hypothetical protein
MSDDNTLGPVREFLTSADAPVLAALLEYSTYRIVEREGFLDIPEPYVEIASPPSFSKAIQGLPQFEKERILRAIAEFDIDVQPYIVSSGHLLLRDRTDIEVPPKRLLLAELMSQRDTLIDVGTGGARFNDVNDYYKARRKRINSHGARFGISDPSPFGDLWEWHKRWCDEEWTTYAERRNFINSLYEPVFASLFDAEEAVVPEREPTGWDRVDRALSKARTIFESAREEEDFQTVGLLCREILISLGQAVYDPDQHPSLDDVAPSSSDAKRMLEAFIAAVVPGEPNETIRRHARASLSLALDLQHRRTATFRQAALCLEATSSTSNVAAILAGRRGPTGDAASDQV